jgi:TolB-like protein/DNA-binding winged helix-turn-helix (wHTH) protein/tetratricopeptide (TPR) repeat protein
MPRLSSRARAARFGPFTVDLRTGELLKNGRRIRLQVKPFRILAALLEAPGELVSREELRRRLWPDDTFVNFDHSLGNALNRLREVLNDSAESPRYIETLPKRGFRLIVPVAVEEEPEQEPETPSAPALKEKAQAVAPRKWGSRRSKLIIAALSFAAAVILAAVTWRTLRERVPTRALLVVLPFENLSGDSTQELFCAGMTEEMIAQLGRLDPTQLGVIGRLSAMQYKGRSSGVEQIGKELNVDYVLESSVRLQEGGRVRITVRLVKVRDQVQLWTQSYDRPTDDILEVQTDVAMGVARAIRMRLANQQPSRLGYEQHVNPEAREAYLRGRHFLDKFSYDGLGHSIRYFNLALEKEPDYALAQSWQAASHALLGHFAVLRPSEAYPKCKEFAGKAIQNAPQLAEPHTQLGLCTMFYDYDWATAERELKTALQLDPNSPLAHYGYSTYLLARGQFSEALAEIEQARALDPLSLIVNSDLAWFHFAAGRYPQAEAQLKKTLELDPNFPVAHLYLGDLYQHMGREAEAFEELVELTRLTGGAERIPMLRRAFSTNGMIGVRRQDLIRLQHTERNTYVPAYWLALAHANLGEKDRALEALELAYAERHWMMTLLKVDPRLNAMRSEQRFQELLKKVGLN